MNFGEALADLKNGHRVCRSGWNGKGMFLFLVPGSVFKVNREPLLSILGEGKEVQYHAHVDMKTVQGYVIPWLCSQADMIAMVLWNVGEFRELMDYLLDVTHRRAMHIAQLGLPMDQAYAYGAFREGQNSVVEMVLKMIAEGRQQAAAPPRDASQ